MKKDFLSITDLTENEIMHVFARADAFKKGERSSALSSKSVVLVFEKASTRTRVSFEAGISRLGGHPVVLTPDASQMGRGEPIKDTARILSGYAHAIVMRTFGHSRIEEMASWADVPVINALTDLLHPCQVLSDCFTLKQRFGDLRGRKIGWVGDGNNMANSWINAASLFGFDLWLACPEGFGPERKIMDAAISRGARIKLVGDPRDAARDAIAVNTDVWVSMGQEQEAGLREEKFKGFQVDSDLMALAASNAVFMHCLPAHRGQEVSEEVLESPRSIVWEQALNRLYVQMALMELLMQERNG